MDGKEKVHSRLFFAALAITALTYSVSQTMLIPSLPKIAHDFDETPAHVTILMSAFWVSGAVTTGVFGRLGDMFGKRLMILIQLALFSLGALVAALSPSLLPMLGGRVLMGIGVGIFPLSYALVRDEIPPERVTGMIAVLAGMTAAGAAIGQSTGGVVADALGYRSVFWLAVVLGLTSLGLVRAFVPESPVRTGGRVDLGGAALFAAGIAAPLIAITETPSWGWLDVRTLLLFGLGAGLLASFVRYERRVREPLIDIATLMLPRIRLTNAATLFVGMGFFGFSIILTQFFQEPASTGYGVGASASQAGLYVVPGLITLSLASIVAGRLSTRKGPVVTFRLGIVISTIGALAMTLSHSHTWELYLWPAFVYGGSGATLGAMPTIILQSVPVDQTGQSSAINMILRTTGSAVGVQLAATFVTSSIDPSGFPTDMGYTAAFMVSTLAGVIALALALAIPRRLGSVLPVRPIDPVVSAPPPA